MSDIFSIAFQDSTFKNSKWTEPKFIFRMMSFLGIVSSIKVVIRDIFTSKLKDNLLKFSYVISDRVKVYGI